MKRLTISLVIIALAAGSIFAQPIRDAQQERNNRPEAQNHREAPNRPQANNVTVEGTLKLEKGFVAVESGTDVYLVPMLNRYIGFIGGLKEGAKVTVEGRGFRNMIQPSKVNIDGKAYDFNIPAQGQNFQNKNFNNRNDRQGNRPDRNNFSHGRKNAHGRDGCRCR